MRILHEESRDHGANITLRELNLSVLHDEVNAGS